MFYGHLNFFNHSGIIVLFSCDHIYFFLLKQYDYFCLNLVLI